MQSQFPSCEKKISISCLNLHYSLIVKNDISKPNTAASRGTDEEHKSRELQELEERDSTQSSVATNSANAVSEHAYIVCIENND